MNFVNSYIDFFRLLKTLTLRSFLKETSNINACISVMKVINTYYWQLKIIVSYQQLSTQTINKNYQQFVPDDIVFMLFTCMCNNISIEKNKNNLHFTVAVYISLPVYQMYFQKLCSIQKQIKSPKKMSVFGKNISCCLSKF